MLPHFLLLLTILGPGNSLQLWDTREHETKEASDPGHLRERRQVDADDGFEDSDDYHEENTDPPEFINITSTVAAHPEPLTTMAMLEQRESKGAGTSEPATSNIATTHLAGPDAGGPIVGMLSTESHTQWRPTTVYVTRPAPMEAETSQPAPREAETPQPAPTEAETSQPAPREAETSQPAPTEAETSHPAPMEAETSYPAPMEAETSHPAPMEAETSHPAPIEAETSHPAPMEAETSELPRNQVIESLFAKSTATEAPSAQPIATNTTATESNDSINFLGSSVTHSDNNVSTGHFPDTGLKKGLIVTPSSSLVPTPPGTSDLIPVRQCLLAILILASLATIFLVCTVVLAVRLSRKNHTYPVRNYSPTEMICISSLLPEGGEGAPVTANGGLSKAQDLKTEPGEARDGDDLTLHSFLP
ncbi:P-selectin glycoprotein ligand 1 [Meriones unguiculatus]|uniref:P-selectin glycoprotein ligand 1 n=1 Tax=Meriones unguiculatus TaxID=10047 RepID=UPI000B4EEFA5|nr:P-selectin glycoprotein ligand 1-like [Meriones unguiculatus]XP_021501717.1 P-selectin glycoprotein ligand 1-like [Meriones unguiculatus]XP_021501718.1 P-selectin glycoprotein ligand 1-like [Meriones unguiculatus]XP_021501719.1 P-selectin glycoprotein ligand 1 [Meriones unguiculatus]XP_021501720.1 P-selectin glycoprotein ligand 1 [Meriones unguiculatus]XP_021501721.1 P-selectin glycoprotein ligand 1-like [Meriones unguiculatus]XP_060238574.1 P-selectin glycoprotein ligand 1 [Meriones ungui